MLWFYEMERTYEQNREKLVCFRLPPLRLTRCSKHPNLTRKNKDQSCGHLVVFTFSIKCIRVLRKISTSRAFEDKLFA